MNHVVVPAGPDSNGLKTGARQFVLGWIGELLQVRTSERRHVGYFFLFFLLIGMGLAIGRGTSDALFFKRYGVQYLPYVYMAHAGILLVITMTYAAVADRLAAEKLFRFLFQALVVLLLAGWAMMAWPEMTAVYPLYYLLYEIASDILMLHAGVYIAQNFETQQAKRLTPLIFAGAQFGIIGGGLFLALTVGVLGVSNLIVVWVALVMAGLLLMVRHHRRYGASTHFRPGRRGQPGLGHMFTQIGQGLTFARRSPLMLWSSLALFFTVFTFYITSYAVSLIYTGAFTTEAELTAFFGWLTIATGIAALLLQLLVTGRLLHRLGVRNVNLIFPTTTVASLALLLATFTVPAALLASFNKDALMRAFRNPVRSLLFNALPGNMQGRARAVATGLVMPLALVLTGGFLAVYTKLASPTVFLAVGLTAAILYLGCNVQANRAYARGILQILRERLFVGSKGVDDALQGAGPDALVILRRGVAQENDDIALSAAKALIDRFPQQAADAVLDRLSTASMVNRDRLVRLLRPLDSPAVRTRLKTMLPSADDHLQNTIYEWLIGVRDEGMRNDVVKLLESPNPRHAALGVYAVQHFPIAPLERQASQRLSGMLNDPKPGALIAGLEQLARRPERRHETDLRNLLEHENVRVRLAALAVLAVWPEPEFPGIDGILAKHSRDPQVAVRRAAVRAFRLLPEGERHQRCRVALEDLDAEVRNLAAAEIMAGKEKDIETLAIWLYAGLDLPRACAAVLDYLLTLKPPRAVLDDIARELAIRASDYIEIRVRLLRHPLSAGSNPAAQQTLTLVLAERARQLIDLALTAMGAVEDPEGARLIRAGLQSVDRRHYASAREALRHINNRELADRLDTVLEAIDHDNEPGRRNADDKSLHDLLLQLTRSSDPWLRECVERVLGVTRTEAA